MIVDFSELQIITVSFNHAHHLNEYFQSFINVFGEFPAPIYIADNKSTDNSLQIIQNWQNQYPKKIFVKSNDKNLGFSKANNLLSDQSQSKYLLFLNPDISFNQDFLSPCLSYIQDKNICLSPAFIDPRSNNPYNNFDSFYDNPFYTIHKVLSKSFSSKFHKVDWIQGACLFLHRKHFEKAKKFNEQYFVFTEDMHLGKELKKLGVHSYINKNFNVFHPYREISKTQSRYMLENLVKYHKEYLIYPYLFHLLLTQIIRLQQISFIDLWKSIRNEK